MKRRMTDRCGFVLVYVCVLIIVIIGMIGLAIDTEWAGYSAQQLQIAADAAALAGADQLQRDPSLAIAQAQSIAAANKAGGSYVNLLASDIQLGTWVKGVGFTPLTGNANINTANAVRVNASMTAARSNAVPLFFGPAFGTGKIDQARASIASIERGSTWEIVIAQDRTGSFADEINDAKAADQVLVTTLFNKSTSASKLALITFNGFGNVVTGLQPYATRQTVINGINAIVTCDKGGVKCSGTNIAAGIDAAVLQFPTTPPAAGVSRAIIIVSDGKPESSTARVPFIATSTLSTMGTASANAAAAKGISIFTLLFNRTNDPTDRAYLASLVRGSGIALDTPDAAQLPTLMAVIGSKLKQSASLVK